MRTPVWLNILNYVFKIPLPILHAKGKGKEVMMSARHKIIIGLVLIGFLSHFSFAIEWVQKAPMPTPRSSLGIAAIDEKIYAIGGRNTTSSLNIVEIYDSGSDTWSTGSSMPSPRRDFGIGVIDGKIYLIGGYDGTNVLSSVLEYNPSNDSWTLKSPMPTPREWLAVVVVDDKIYAIGGDDGDNYLNTCEEYDPVSDSWTTKTPMPTARGGLTAQAVSGKIYAIGGLPSGVTPCRTVEEYNPVNDSWSSKTNMLTARYGLSSAVVNNNIYALGGGPPFSLSTVECYNPSLNSWNNETSMLTARWGLGSVALAQKIYAIGGQTLYHSGYTNVNEEGGVQVGTEEFIDKRLKIQLKIYPNPFAKRTKISYQASKEQLVSLKIYNSSGSLIKRFYNLENQNLQPINHISWDGSDQSGEKVLPGIYFICCETGSYKTTEKLILLR